MGQYQIKARRGTALGHCSQGRAQEGSALEQTRVRSCYSTAGEIEHGSGEIEQTDAVPPLSQCQGIAARTRAGVKYPQISGGSQVLQQIMQRQPFA